MDCRTTVLVAFLLSMCSGCITTTQSAPVGLNENVVVQKAKEEPKRTPLPGTVVALAVLKEREADKSKDSAEQIRLYDEARRFYQEALKIDAAYRDAVQGLARVYMRMDDFEHAFEAYRKALDKNPKDHGMWFDMGTCHNRHKDLAQAIGCFQKALEIDPENIQYMKTLGFTLARAGQVEQSLPYLTRALGSALAHYNIARMLEHMGQVDPSRQHLQIALQINPNCEQAREMLAAMEGPRGATLSFASE